MIHGTEEQPADPARDIELRVRITPGRADTPWRAVVYGPDENGPLPFDQPETFIAYLRRRWLLTGLR